MMRPSTILWMVLFVVAAFGLYMVKYRVQAIKTEVATTEKQLREEKKNMHVLEAEWTYLNRPERLRQLSAKYLDVKPAKAQQIAEFVTFPYSNQAAPVQRASEEEAIPVVKGITLASGVAHGK